MSIRTDLINAAATWVDQDGDGVLDGPFITSRSPADLDALCAHSGAGRALLPPHEARTVASTAGGLG